MQGAQRVLRGSVRTDRPLRRMRGRYLCFPGACLMPKLRGSLLPGSRVSSAAQGTVRSKPIVETGAILSGSSSASGWPGTRSRSGVDRQGSLPGSALGPPHFHTAEDKFSIVTHAAMGFRSGSFEVTLEADDYIVKPRSELHAMCNAGPAEPRDARGHHAVGGSRGSSGS